MGIDDRELLDAVTTHTTGDVRMTPLAKILFLADKLEPVRGKPPVELETIRELAWIDLDQALFGVYAWRIREVVSRDEHIDERLLAARDRLIERSLGSEA
jgi:HD superfamily phosphohydrolase YqeK